MPKKVSLKEIVKAIDKVLDELESQKKKAAKGAKAKGVTYTKAQDDTNERTKKILRGMRESVEGICFPVMDAPME